MTAPAWDDRTSTLVEETTRSLPELLPPLDPQRASIRVARDVRRPRSHLLTLVVEQDGRSPTRLFVKATNPVDLPPQGPDRPRLQPLTPTSERTGLEMVALRSLHERVSQLGDRRFTAVEPLGLIAGGTAIVMRDHPGRDLSRELVTHVVGPVGRETLGHIQAAGELLRVIHGLPGGPKTAPRQADRAAVAQAFRALGDFLARETGHPELSDAASIGARAAKLLPEPLPLVLTHGDYAPRNLLVDAGDRIAVIDLLARWRAPAYEDVAAFLVSLRTSRLNAASGGLALGRAIRRLEPAFLEGYYGADPVPVDALRVYELLVVLDKWSARIVRSGGNSRRRRVLEALIERHFWRLARELARDVAASLGTASRL